MCQLAKDQRKALLAQSRKAVERMVQEALSQLEEPTLISCAGSTGTVPFSAAGHILTACCVRLVLGPQ